MMSQIVGISGNMGAGKTTLSKALAEAYQSTWVGWDDFDDISQAPEDLVDWYKGGQDYMAWDYQPLADVMQALKSNQPILHPVLKTMLHPTEYIIFDAPLGRLHQQTGQFIDLWIHLDVPLDVSLGRHLLRDFKASDKTKEELLQTTQITRELALKHSYNFSSRLHVELWGQERNK